MGVGRIRNLVELQRRACSRYAGHRLFGTKQGGAYRWSTYGELGEQVTWARGGLAALGVRAGDRVALIVDNRAEWAAVAYAAYGLAACVVPMYERQSESERAFMLRDSGAKVVVVGTRALAERLRSLGLGGVVHLDGAGAGSFVELLAVGRSSGVEAIEPSAETLAGFIYTSGTTGSPKGVMLSHGNLASNINAVQDLFPMGEDDCSLSFLPWAHAFGQTCELHCMLANGASVAFAESVGTISQNLLEVRPTLLFGVPGLFHRMHDGVHRRIGSGGVVQRRLFEAAMEHAVRRRVSREAGERPSAWMERQHGLFDRLVYSRVREAFGGRLRYAISGGAALQVHVARFFDDVGLPIYEGYGLSETSPVCTTNSPGRRKIGSVGRPIPGVEVDIEPVEDVAAGMGEVVIHGPNVMRGYHRLPDETAAVLTGDGGLRTGDLGRIDRDGYLWITGRLKDQYKLETGRYVVPGPLEEQLARSPFIAQALLYGDDRAYNVALIVPDEVVLKAWALERGKRGELSGLVREDEVRALYTEEIAQRSQGFAPHERPMQFDFVLQEFTTDNGLLTPSLKVRRRAVSEAYRDRIEAMYDRSRRQEPGTTSTS